MKIDENTGLPELPEGHFWRIKDSSPEYLRVQIRKRAWIGSKVMAWSVVRKSNATPDEVLRTATLVLWEIKHGANWRNCLGDYPPKKLGA